MLYTHTHTFSEVLDHQKARPGSNVLSLLIIVPSNNTQNVYVNSWYITNARLLCTVTTSDECYAYYSGDAETK